MPKNPVLACIGIWPIPARNGTLRTRAALAQNGAPLPEGATFSPSPLRAATSVNGHSATYDSELPQTDRLILSSQHTHPPGENRDTSQDLRTSRRTCLERRASSREGQLSHPLWSWPQLWFYRKALLRAFAGFASRIETPAVESLRVRPKIRMAMGEIRQARHRRQPRPHPSPANSLLRCAARTTATGRCRRGLLRVHCPRFPEGSCWWPKPFLPELPHPPSDQAPLEKRKCHHSQQQPSASMQREIIRSKAWLRFQGAWRARDCSTAISLAASPSEYDSPSAAKTRTPARLRK